MSIPNLFRQYLPYGNRQKGIQIDQPEAQVYEDYHNRSQGANETSSDQDVELRPMQKQSNSNKPLSELPSRSSQKEGNADRSPPDLNKPLPDLPPEAFEKPISTATSAKTHESSNSQAEQASNNTGINRAHHQAKQEKPQYCRTQAQSGDDPAQSLRKLQENEREGRATRIRDGAELGIQAGKSRQRVRWLDEQ